VTRGKEEYQEKIRRWKRKVSRCGGKECEVEAN
jgi:hypothetical protein